MAANTGRVFTRLAGLPAAKDPQRELLKVFGKALRALETLPKDFKYRVELEKAIKEKRAIAQSTNNPEEIEKRLGEGLCEEIVQQVNNEIHLIKTMEQSKPWEPLTEQPPPNQWKWPL